MGLRGSTCLLKKYGITPLQPGWLCLAGKRALLPIGSAHFVPFQGTEGPEALNRAAFTSHCIHTKLKPRRNPTEPDTQYKWQYFYPPIYIAYCLLQCPGIRLTARMLLSGFPCTQMLNLEAAKDALPWENKSCSKCFGIFSLFSSRQVVAFARVGCCNNQAAEPELQGAKSQVEKALFFLILIFISQGHFSECGY